MDSAMTENAWDRKKGTQNSWGKEIDNLVQRCRTLGCHWSLTVVSSQLQIAKLDLDLHILIEKVSNCEVRKLSGSLTGFPHTKPQGGFNPSPMIPT